MIFNDQDRYNVQCVTLSEAKGLSMGTQMLRFAQHDIPGFGRENS